MIRMSKKQGNRTRTKQGISEPSSDLDANAALPPISSVRDLTPEAVATWLKNSRYLQILIGLTLIGLLLRFYQLGFNSLWLDEASTLTFARQSLVGIWESTAGGEFNPPLFYWLESGMLAFGDSEVVLRFIPALLGVLTIPTVYLVGKEFKDRNTGLIAAALLTFSPFHTFYSQEARAYAPMLFFFSLALLFYLKAIKTNEVRSWALFGVFSALAFWMHFYVLIPIGILVLHALVVSANTIRNDPRSSRNIFLSVAVFIGASLPLLIVTANLFLVRTSSAPTFGIQGLDIIYQTVLQISGFNELVLVFYVALFAVGTVITWRENRSGALLLIFMTILPLIFSYVLSTRMPMIPRYLIYLLPVYFVGIASSYTGIYSIIKSKKVMYGFIAVIILISLPFYASYYSSFQKNDWRGFSGILQQNTAEGDIIVVLPGYMTQPLDYYYQSATDTTLEYGATTAQDLQTITDRYPDRRIFYVMTEDIFAANPGRDAVDWLEQHAQFAGQHTGIYIFVSG